jgi:glycerol-1-phosphate dehydrogenase [NAD(P)+]
VSAFGSWDVGWERLDWPTEDDADQWWEDPDDVANGRSFDDPIALYEALDELRQTDFDDEGALKAWPDHAANDREINSLFPEDKLKEIAARESAAKLASADVLRQQLARLKEGWPELSRRIHNQLFPHAEFQHMLHEAGAPVESDEIGIDTDRLRRSYLLAYHIRRPFTVLDLARRTGLLEPALDKIPLPCREGQGEGLTTRRPVPKKTSRRATPSGNHDGVAVRLAIQT